jgi:hypothetical protein
MLPCSAPGHFRSAILFFLDSVKNTLPKGSVKTLKIRKKFFRGLMKEFFQRINEGLFQDPVLARPEVAGTLGLEARPLVRSGIGQRIPAF